MNDQARNLAIQKHQKVCVFVYFLKINHFKLCLNGEITVALGEEDAKAEDAEVDDEAEEVEEVEEVEGKWLVWQTACIIRNASTTHYHFAHTLKHKETISFAFR